MSTYFIHDNQGELLGWIEAIDDSSARSMAEALHGKDISLSDDPKNEWYARRQEANDIAHCTQ